MKAALKNSAVDEHREGVNSTREALSHPGEPRLVQESTKAPAPKDRTPLSWFRRRTNSRSADIENAAGEEALRLGGENQS